MSKHTKTAIVNYGLSRQGKSTTIKIVYEEIKRLYPKHRILKEECSRKSVYGILEIGDNFRVGVVNFGDPGSDLPKAFGGFIEANCDIIIAVCRTSGATKNEVLNLSKQGFRIIWVANMHSATHAIRDSLNERYVKTILDLVDDILKGKL